MKKTTLTIAEESKTPPDKRTPLTPSQAEEIQQKYPHVSVQVQRSATRIFSDRDYRDKGIKIVSDISNSDIIMGVKEVAIPRLIPEKTYLFFSHTIKKQSYNRTLLQQILEKRIRLIDYEALVDQSGNRLVAFGRYAGIVGGYNALFAYGEKYGDYTLPRAFNCFDVNELKSVLQKIQLPAIKIVLTGGGRVTKGVMEILAISGVRKVSPDDFLNVTYEEPVYVQLIDEDYHKSKAKKLFSRTEFHQNPKDYYSTFLPYTRVANVLIAGSYWHPDAPVLFNRSDMTDIDFSIRIIADITCDIEGSIPSTKRASTIADPLYDYNPVSGTVNPPLSARDHVTVMAIDNLPCELPRSASEDFGAGLIKHIMPALLVEDYEDIIRNATIAEHGMLTEKFDYLRSYVEERKS